MINLLFAILMLLIFGKLFLFAIRMAWGITKIIVFLIILPILLIVFVLQGLLILAMPILLIVGVISLFVARD